MGEKKPLTKKLPATTTVKYQYFPCNIMLRLESIKTFKQSFLLLCFSQVGKLKFLCDSFFKLKSMKLNLFLQEEVCLY